jgi:hypothetical protein
MRLKKPVDILIIRTAPCGFDSRVSKFLFHYKKIGETVALTCLSREQKCARQSSGQNIHKNFKQLNVNDLPFPLTVTPINQIFWRFHRIFLASEFIISSLRISLYWRPKVIHCTDLDGYLIAKIAFPFNKKKIFEVYDPWQTMTNKIRIRRIENKAFLNAKVLVMPAEDSRIKVDREKITSFSNFMDPDLADLLLQDTEIDDDFVRKIESLKPYILSGGIISKETKIVELTETMNSQKSLNLVIASEQKNLTNLNFGDIPSNVHFIGKQKWSKWLYLVKNSNAVWVYYSPTHTHFASHISPNKYWEALLFKKPILISKEGQFCDRSTLEGKLYELEDDFDLRLNLALAEITSINSTSTENNDIRGRILNTMQNDRTRKVEKILNWVRE